MNYLTAVCAALGFLAPLAANAEATQACKDLLAGQRMTIAVPNNAGGGYDTYARSLAPSIAAAGGLSVRVVNMPTGGGLAARAAVMNAAETDLAVLIENAADLVTAPMSELGRGTQADKTYMIEGLQIVGILHAGWSGWLARKGLDISGPEVDSLIAADGSVEEAFLPILAVAAAIGKNAEAVSGYEGTSEQAASILRGETDIASMSLSTAFLLAKDEGLEVVLALSEGAVGAYPNLPYLAGEGSVVWQMTEDLPEEEKTRRRDIASTVALLRNTARGLFVSSNMPEQTRNCVAQIMDVAVADPAFINLAESQNRPVDAMTAAQAGLFVEKLRDAQMRSQPILQEIEASLLGD